MLWVGIFLAVIGGILIFLSTRSATKAVHMQTMETSRVGDLTSLVAEIAAELPGESTGFSEYVELKGKCACDEPLTSELSNQPCAISETTVQRKYEEQREERDSDGDVRTRWVTANEVVSHNRREAPFFLDDGSGRVRVLAKGAAPDLVKVLDRFEPAQAVEQAGGTLAFGGFSLSLGGDGYGSHRRTVGYHFSEQILPLDHSLYALGELADTSGGVVIRKPQGDDDRPFMLSLKSEEELVQSTQSSAKWQRIVGIGLIAGGVVLAVIGLVR